VTRALDLLHSGRYGRPMGPGVPVGEPVTGRLGALDDLPKVVVRSVTSGSAIGRSDGALTSFGTGSDTRRDQLPGTDARRLPPRRPDTTSFRAA
jgi:hypothetical protein